MKTAIIPIILIVGSIYKLNQDWSPSFGLKINVLKFDNFSDIEEYKAVIPWPTLIKNDLVSFSIFWIVEGVWSISSLWFGFDFGEGKVRVSSFRIIRINTINVFRSFY